MFQNKPDTKSPSEITKKFKELQGMKVTFPKEMTYEGSAFDFEMKSLFRAKPTQKSERNPQIKAKEPLPVPKEPQSVPVERGGHGEFEPPAPTKEQLRDPVNDPMQNWNSSKETKKPKPPQEVPIRQQPSVIEQSQSQKETPGPQSENNGNNGNNGAKKSRIEKVEESKELEVNPANTFFEAKPVNDEKPVHSFDDFWSHSHAFGAPETKVANQRNDMKDLGWNRAASNPPSSGFDHSLPLKKSSTQGDDPEEEKETRKTIDPSFSAFQFPGCKRDQPIETFIPEKEEPFVNNPFGNSMASEERPMVESVIVKQMNQAPSDVSGFEDFFKTSQIVANSPKGNEVQREFGSELKEKQMEMESSSKEIQEKPIQEQKPQENSAFEFSGFSFVKGESDRKKEEPIPRQQREEKKTIDNASAFSFGENPKLKNSEGISEHQKRTEQNEPKNTTARSPFEDFEFNFPKEKPQEQLKELKEAAVGPIKGEFEFKKAQVGFNSQSYQRKTEEMPESLANEHQRPFDDPFTFQKSSEQQIQSGNAFVRDFGEIETKPKERTMVEQSPKEFLNGIEDHSRANQEEMRPSRFERPPSVVHEEKVRKTSPPPVFAGGELQKEQKASNEANLRLFGGSKPSETQSKAPIPEENQRETYQGPSHMMQPSTTWKSSISIEKNQKELKEEHEFSLISQLSQFEKMLQENRRAHQELLQAKTPETIYPRTKPIQSDSSSLSFYSQKSQNSLSQLPKKETSTITHDLQFGHAKPPGSRKVSSRDKHAELQKQLSELQNELVELNQYMSSMKNQDYLASSMGENGNYLGIHLKENKRMPINPVVEASLPRSLANLSHTSSNRPQAVFGPHESQWSLTHRDFLDQKEKKLGVGGHNRFGARENEESGHFWERKERSADTSKIHESPNSSFLLKNEKPIQNDWRKPLSIGGKHDWKQNSLSEISKEIFSSLDQQMFKPYSSHPTEPTGDRMGGIGYSQRPLGFVYQKGASIPIPKASNQKNSENKGALIVSESQYDLLNRGKTPNSVFLEEKNPNAFEKKQTLVHSPMGTLDEGNRNSSFLSRPTSNPSRPSGTFSHLVHHSPPNPNPKAAAQKPERPSHGIQTKPFEDDFQATASRIIKEAMEKCRNSASSSSSNKPMSRSTISNQVKPFNHLEESFSSKKRENQSHYSYLSNSRSPEIPLKVSQELQRIPDFNERPRSNMGAIDFNQDIPHWLDSKEKKWKL